jgi:hypothetical protein
MNAMANAKYTYFLLHPSASIVHLTSNHIPNNTIVLAPVVLPSIYSLHAHFCGIIREMDPGLILSEYCPLRGARVPVCIGILAADE